MSQELSKKTQLAEQTFNRRVSTDLAILFFVAAVLIGLAVAQAAPPLVLVIVLIVTIAITAVRLFAHRQAYFAAMIAPIKR